MQVDSEGEWLYIYTERDMIATESKNDPFRVVHTIRIKDVTGMKLDTSDNSIYLYVNGHPHPVR
jgi:hypothetical protein